MHVYFHKTLLKMKKSQPRVGWTFGKFKKKKNNKVILKIWM